MRTTHLAVPALAMCSAASAAPGFFPLGNVGAPPDGGSHARAVSAAGRAAAGRVGVLTGRLCFRWADGEGMVALGDTPGGTLFPGARGISADASAVIGTNIASSIPHATIWRFPGATPTDLGDLTGGDDSSLGTSISYDGTVAAGFSQSANGTEAFRWSDPDGITPLGDLDGGVFASVASGVSGDGLTIVGGSASANSVTGAFEPFRWTLAGGMLGLGFLPDASDNSGEANAASEHADTIVGRSINANSEFEAFRWTSAGMAPLGILGPSNPKATHGSNAWGVSADGSIIVGESTTDDGIRAVAWDQTHGMRLVTDVMAEAAIALPEGWTLLRAYAVSPGGRVIAGQGTNASAIEEAWILRLPLTGDANADDACNFTDLNIVLSNFGMSGAPGTIPGDVNNDGACNFADLNIVLSNFGNLA